MMSGTTAVVLHREAASGPRESALDLVGDQQHPMLVAQLAQPSQQLRRRDIEAALALHRFDDDRGNALGRIDVSLEQAIDALDSRRRRSMPCKSIGNGA